MNIYRGTPRIPRTIQTSAKTFSLYSQPYLDTYNQCYKNIVTINAIPKGPLASIVKRIQFPALSEFKDYGSCNSTKKCGLALLSIDDTCFCKNDLMDVNEVPNLISYLLSNGYTVDTNITKMLNQSDIRFQTNNANILICFVTYNG